MQKPKCSTSTAATKAKQTGASVSLSLWFFSFEFLALELISRTPRRLQRSRSPCFLAAFQGRKEQQTTTTTRWKGRGGGRGAFARGLHNSVATTTRELGLGFCCSSSSSSRRFRTVYVHTQQFVQSVTEGPHTKNTRVVQQ